MNAAEKWIGGLAILALAGYVGFRYWQSGGREQYEGVRENVSERWNRGEKDFPRVGDSGSKAPGAGGPEEEVFIYSAELAGLIDRVCGGIEGGGDDVSGSIMRCQAMAQEDLSRGGRRAETARLASDLCRRIATVEQTRQKYAKQYAEYRDKPFRTFKEGDAERKKQFFMDQIARQWREYVTQTRPGLEQALARLRQSEG